MLMTHLYIMTLTTTALPCPTPTPMPLTVCLGRRRATRRPRWRALSTLPRRRPRHARCLPRRRRRRRGRGGTAAHLAGTPSATVTGLATTARAARRPARGRLRRPPSRCRRRRRRRALVHCRHRWLRRHRQQRRARCRHGAPHRHSRQPGRLGQQRPLRQLHLQHTSVGRLAAAARRALCLRRARRRADRRSRLFRSLRCLLAAQRRALFNIINRRLQRCRLSLLILSVCDAGRSALLRSLRRQPLLNNNNNNNNNIINNIDCCRLSRQRRCMCRWTLMLAA